MSRATLEVSTTGDVTVATIQPARLVEPDDVAAFARDLATLVEGAPKLRLIVAFGRVHEIASNVLACLIVVQKQLHAEDGSLKLVKLGKAVMDLVRLTRLDAVFACYPDTQRALEAYRTAPLTDDT